MSDAQVTRRELAALALAATLACSANEPSSSAALPQAAHGAAANAAGGAAPAGQTQPDLDAFDVAVFAAPALDFAPGIRWIWPGDDVDPAQLRAEVDRIAA